MRTTLCTLALLVLALPATAHAGGYLSLGVSSDATLGGDLGTQFNSDDLSGARIAVGHRMGPLALEGVFFGTGLRSAEAVTPPGVDNEFATMSLGVDLKYFVGISGALEGYVRGGVNKTWLSPSAPAGDLMAVDLEYVGRGYDVGGGLQYTFRLLPTMEGALWLDYNRQLMELSNESSNTLAGTADMLTLGVSLGL